MGNQVLDIVAFKVPDDDSDTSYIEQCEHRMEQFRKAEFNLIRIYVKARVVIKGTEQFLRSPGQNGIESDEEVSYIDFVIADQLKILYEVLADCHIVLPEFESLLSKVETRCT